jgi:hypothetical protein
MITSEQINELAAALAAAQGEFPPIPKDCTAKIVTKNNGTYSFRYADLDTVLSTVRPVLSRHGLALVVDIQTVKNETGERAMQATIRLIHSSGQWMQTTGLAIAIDPEAYAKQPAQSSGSAATYATRYAIEAALAIRATDDQDGAEASGNHIEVQRRPPPPQPATQQTGTRPALHDSLRSLLQEFHWPEGRKREYSEELLKAYGSSLAECFDDPKCAERIADAINYRIVNEYLGMTRPDALQTLFVSIMEKHNA